MRRNTTLGIPPETFQRLGGAGQIPGKKLEGAT